MTFHVISTMTTTVMTVINYNYFLLHVCNGKTGSANIPCVRSWIQDSLELHAVEPFLHCPHVNAVQPVPTSGLYSNQECLQCGALGENWVCLTCYEVRGSSTFNSPHHFLPGQFPILRYLYPSPLLIGLSKVAK